jgi:hypothetical protein
MQINLTMILNIFFLHIRCVQKIKLCNVGWLLVFCLTFIGDCSALLLVGRLNYWITLEKRHILETMFFFYKQNKLFFHCLVKNILNFSNFKSQRENHIFWGFFARCFSNLKQYLCNNEKTTFEDVTKNMVSLSAFVSYVGVHCVSRVVL